MNTNEIRIPEAHEITVAWTGQRCRVEFGGVEITTRVEGTELGNRYGTDRPADLVDRNRPDGNGGFYAEQVGKPFEKRYALPRIKARVEDRLVGLLRHYFTERKLDADATEVEVEATAEAVRDATGGMLAFDTVAGRLRVVERGRKVVHTLDVEITFDDSEVVGLVRDHSEHEHRDAAPARWFRMVTVEFRHPLYWDKLAEVRARFSSGTANEVELIYASGGANPGTDLADAARLKAEGLLKAASVIEGLEVFEAPAVEK